jgi:hypothetical protein
VSSVYTHEGNGNVGRIWENELHFLKLASSSPVLREEDPIGLSVTYKREDSDALPASARITQAMGDYNCRSVAFYSRNDKWCPSSHSEHEIYSWMCECAAEIVTRRRLPATRGF